MRAPLTSHIASIVLVVIACVLAGCNDAGCPEEYVLRGEKCIALKSLDAGSPTDEHRQDAASDGETGVRHDAVSAGRSSTDAGAGGSESGGTGAGASGSDTHVAGSAGGSAGPEAGGSGVAANAGHGPDANNDPAGTGVVAGTGGGSAGSDDAKQCNPTQEVCDGQDNDCDGIIDNGVKNACGGCGKLMHPPGEPCDNGGEGICAKPGSYECLGETTICNAPDPQPRAEVCDGKDNDCDGIVDNGVKNSCGGCATLDHAPNAPCTAGSGACQGRGSYQCDGMDAVICNAVALRPTDEICDGKDNDCNGQIDDGVMTTWYPDCDGDDYASQSPGVDACSKPAPMDGCGWTSRKPTVDETDCNDRLEIAHPGADFGLPITRTGATLPQANDPAYDLNCDGKLEYAGTTLSTGKIIDGKLEIVPFCPETFECHFGEPFCITFVVQLGEAVTTCGQQYLIDTGCSDKVPLYNLCK